MNAAKIAFLGAAVIFLAIIIFRGCANDWRPLQPKTITVQVPLPPLILRQVHVTRDTVLFPVADSTLTARLRRAVHERDSLRRLLAVAGVQQIVSVDTITTAGDSLRLEYDEISRRMLLLSFAPSPRSVLYQPPPLPLPLGTLGALYECPPPPSTFDNIARWVLPSLAAGITAGFIIR